MTVLRVVIADDQGIVRGGLRMILEAAGMEVVGEAADGRAAIDLVTRTRPDVVLMDIRMPGVDGISATRQITRDHPTVKILILTNLAQNKASQEALKAQADGYIVKADIVPSELVEVVKNLIG